MTSEVSDVNVNDAKGWGTACDMEVRGGGGQNQSKLRGCGQSQKHLIICRLCARDFIFFGKYHFWVFIPEMRLKKSKNRFHTQDYGMYCVILVF